MKKSFAFIFALLLFLLVACNSADNSSAQQSDDSPLEMTMPELEKTDWLAVSTDAEVFNLNGGLDNPNFEYVFNHTDAAPLDQLIAFYPERGMWLILPTAAPLFSGSGNVEGMNKKGR